MENKELKWYAARITGAGAKQVLESLSQKAERIYVTRHVPGIVFVRCLNKDTYNLYKEFSGHLFFYSDAERKQAGSIPDLEMNNFILVTSSNEEILNLGPVTEDFMTGQRVRVIAGPFAGAEGIVKRIKGDRRLVVSINGVTAVATCFIHPSFLKPVQQ